MDFNVEARKLQLENLEQFISSYKHKVQDILSNLGWNIKDTLQETQFITCSLDPSHKVPQKAVDNHIKNCALRKEGYSLNEKFLSEPQQGPFAIHIDDHKKIEILSAAHKSIANFKSGWNGQDPDPKTSDRLTSTFSADERLALYDYALSNTIGPPKLPEFDIFIANRKGDNDRPLTYEEKLALERDLKRRKIKYKSVHTSHKNHTEVLREVIEGQMELYRDWLNNTSCTQTTDTESEVLKWDLEHARTTVISRNSNTSCSSRDTRKRQDEANDSKSTSRRTSIDRESDKSESSKSKRRSTSLDNRRRYREDRYEKHRERHDYRREKDYSPQDKYKYTNRRRSNSLERRSSSRVRQRSRERRHNGYRVNRK